MAGSDDRGTALQAVTHPARLRTNAIRPNESHPMRHQAWFISLTLLAGACSHASPVAHAGNSAASNVLATSLVGATTSLVPLQRGQTSILGVVDQAVVQACELNLTWVDASQPAASIDLRAVRFVFGAPSDSVRVIAASSTATSFAITGQRHAEVTQALLTAARECGATPSDEAPLQVVYI